MKEETMVSVLPCELPIEHTIPVQIIQNKGMAHARKVLTNLVTTPTLLHAHFQERRIVK
ncbi:hypothetical protein HYT95_01575, partial [Candidatus Peregrinibacteria bacterium]|nr:hypothetical protein [Candidatus Peregrinibacteria bacterium]